MGCSVEKKEAVLKKMLPPSNQPIAVLAKELTRKEKALAEAAALLVLRKKLDAMFGHQSKTGCQQGL